MKLTKRICDNLKPLEKPYKKYDAQGLYLEIMPSGNKLWRFKYKYLGKEKRISLGKYPVVTLLKAREKRIEFQRQLNEGIDPSRNKIEKEKLAKRANNNTFENVAQEWFDRKKAQWSEAHANDIWHRLEKDAFPYIGKRPIDKITPSDVLELLTIMENRNAIELAKRCKQNIGRVFRFGILSERCSNDPTQCLSDVLRTRRVKHFAALNSDELPQFLKDLARNEPRLYARTRRAIKLSLLTFCRPGEIRQAEWSEINFDESEWIIPAEKMKMRRDHIVPLAHQTIKVLLEQYEETGQSNTPWVFPSQIRIHKPMSDGTVNVALKKLGYAGRQTAHGFRALARTTIREKLKYYPDIIEAQLAHKPSGPLGSAYDRAQFLDDRKEMMQDWADYIDLLRIK
ncbi:MAG: tyrosine-type recombinase/integrase [Gelidibacter sp.]|nr:tyrosine-type recombinase/integrase [Gelidibacter sp.]